MAYPPPISIPPWFPMREHLLHLYPELAESGGLAHFIRHRRELAENYAVEGVYTEALNQNNTVLHCLFSFDLDHLHEEDFWKTMSNTSLCLYELGQYQQALHCASLCIGMAPHYPMGYWRAGKASKICLGLETALFYFANGLGVLHKQNPAGNNDTVSFLTEIVALIPQVKETAAAVVGHVLADIKLPENPQILFGVVQTLANANSWEGVCLLVLGIHDGPRSVLDGAAESCTFEHISVANLLIIESNHVTNDWRRKLAIHMLKNGASGNEIDARLKTPSVHFGIDVALRTDNIATPQKWDDKDPTLSNVTQINGTHMAENHSEEIQHTKMSEMQSQNKAVTQVQVNAKAQAQVKANSGKKPGQQRLHRVRNKGKGHVTSRAAVQFPYDCDSCEILIEDSELDFILGDLNDGYQKLVRVLEFKHATPMHMRVVDRVISIIVDKLGETLAPEIPDSLIAMPEVMYEHVIKGLIKGKKWRQLDAVVRKYRNKNGSDKIKIFVSSVDVIEVVDDTSFGTAEDEQLQIVISLLNSGASLGRDDGTAVVQAAISKGHFKVVAELLKRGASLSALSLAVGDTPIHAALTIGLEKDKGNLTLFETLLRQYDSEPKEFACLDPSQVDGNGDCLFHVLSRCKYSNTALKVIQMLCARKLNSNVRNSDGKLPIDYILKKHDRRKQFLRLAANAQATHNENRSYEQHSSINENSKKEEIVDEPARKDTETVKHSTQMEVLRNKIEEKIRLLEESKMSAFSLSVNNTSARRTRQEPGTTTQSLIDSEQGNMQFKEPSVSTGTTSGETNQEVELSFKKIKEEQGVRQEPGAQANQESETHDALDIGCMEAEEKENGENEEMGELEEIQIDAQEFDGLAWEVECTADVWKKLRDKQIPLDMKTKIVQTIYMLASGEWHPQLCKKINEVPPSLQLHEAKLCKGGIVLWELAIAFSPRRSETAEQRLAGEEGGALHSVIGGRIYSEIIRVWDILLVQDKPYRSIQKAAERIIRSHNRGKSCIIQKKLMGIPSFQTQPSKEQRIPILFAETEVDVDVNNLSEQQQKYLLQYFPPASPNEREFNILKFYSFNTALVSHILQNKDIKVDFPFRVTDLEHAIITIGSKAPLLLLGRSGTGKTTCCVYRLWSEFLSYWRKAKEAGAPLLPRTIDYIHHEEEKNKGEVVGEKDVTNLNEETGSDLKSDGDMNDETQQGADGVQEEENDGSHYDHLHQIFITKNAVLCSEVRKNFHELSHACDIVPNHVEREAENLPSRLQDVDEILYPLFLNSRQLLLMLDASIGAPYFFERKEDGSLKGDIQGWSENDGPLSILPLLNEESDAEEEEAYDDRNDDIDDVDQAALVARIHQRKLDPRREVTYEVFVDEVWPRTKKHMKVVYHPSLVWTEIMSFIKGSFEALSKPCGYLSKEEYIEIGRKRAPNFSGERDKIYEYFIRYDHFKKHNSLFDEIDLVHDIYKRIRNIQMVPWGIHQIFVDETQDFTQAELCLLIRICQNPNQMFLTGDTAQSIMRGISFRFSDLKSLFYHVRQSMQAMGRNGSIEIPKHVYQLTHNYRSHAGILSLASSVLDLLVEFFPESFDRLKNDQGLFNGPKPILLESCSFSDLAVLLRGNRRKTSHIDFGAHQAILVVDEAARESIPEELRHGLILTIYEAKGLEFDDVLLYNFFKDSQASKEWRVVTSYLETLWISNTDSSKGTSSFTCKSLVEVDEGVLLQEGRSRTLAFDPNQHKVLNSELKYLYTAVTRARATLWIFDADAEKRAPMFEYFKARKLVKCLTVEELTEASLSDTMFAEMSSPSDWICRGEEFMKLALYDVGAKCFGMAGDTVKQKVALAHQRALVASRMKGNPLAMSEEFLKAADQYLECDRPDKAALCLLNARERELAAQLFEKCGQFERAGEIYRRLRLPLASSRCYELAGHFNRAVEVLSDNESYDMAIDTLQRYKMKTEEYERRGEPIPQILTTNKPSDKFSVERLSYVAANLFHKQDNRERMLAALDRLTRWQDKVQFLKGKGYMTEAAQAMEENGQVEEAVKLLLINGKIEQAESMARRTRHDNTIAQTLLVYLQVILSCQPEERPSTNDLHRIAKEAKELFHGCKNVDGFADASLILAELAEGVPDLTESMSHIKQAHKSFQESKPYGNLAGILECVEWIVTRKQINKDNFMYLVHGFDHLFRVVQILCCPTTAKDKELLLKYDSFYGLFTTKPDHVIYCPELKPRCKDIIKDFLQYKQESCKQVEIDIEKKAVNERIALFLLNRAKRWLQDAAEEITRMRNEFQQCLFYQIGITCPDMEKRDGRCPNIHCPLTIRIFEEVMEIDIMFIELQRNIEFGARNLSVMCPASLTEQVEFFLHYSVNTSHEDVNSFTSCENILQDLMPMSYHPLVLSKGYPRKVLRKMSRPVKNYMKAYMEKRWKEDTEGEQIFSTYAAKSADVFLMVELCSRLFSIDFNVDTKMRDFECALSKEQNQDNTDRDYRCLALIRDHESQSKSGSNWIVESLARRFCDSYLHLTKSASDPLEALNKFSNFTALICTKVIEVIPDRKFFLIWLEFYITLSFFLIAKVNNKKQRNYPKLPGISFFVPNSYLHLMDFIEATFPREAMSIQKAVNRFIPRKNSLMLIQDRLDRIVLMLCGSSKSISLINVLFSSGLDNFFSCAMAERVLVLAMTLVSNVGTFTSVKSETVVMQALTQLQPPEKCPKRLMVALESVQKAQCIRDVGASLKALLREREDDQLMCCKWILTSVRKDHRDHIQSSPLTNTGFLPANFLSEYTLTAISQGAGLAPVLLEPLVDLEEETQMSLEEKMKWKNDTTAREKAEMEKVAGIKILRLLKSLAFAAKCRNLKFRVETQMAKEEQEEKMTLFETAKVTDVMCGICNVYFECLLEESILNGDSFSHSFNLGKTNANNVNRLDLEDKEASDAVVAVARNFTVSNNDTTIQEKDANIVALYDRSGDISKGHSSSKEGEINMNNNALFGERTADTHCKYFAYEFVPENEETEGPPEKDFTEMRAQKLTRIKNEHIQSQDHLQKQLEFYSFENLFKDKVEPQRKFLQDYILKYELCNSHIRDTEYKDLQLEINRIFQCMTLIHQEMNRILHEKSWRSTQGLQQLLGDMLEAYNAVQQQVDESYRKYKQRKEERHAATVSQVKVQTNEDWEDVIEDVVDDPSNKFRSHVYSSRRRGQNH